MTAVRGTGRPKTGYFLGSDRVPSATTITGRFKDPGGLYYGHWRNGSEGRGYNDWGGTDALTVGDQVHKRVEAFLHGDELPELSSLEAINAWEAWHEWWQGNRFEVVATEVPLVSRLHRFGGTIDTVLRDSRGRTCIGDWKTSGGIYGDYLVQVAAYGLLWDEHHPDEPLDGGYHIGRFSKEDGDLEHRHFRSMRDEQQLFLLWRAAYALDKRVSKRAR